MNWLGLIAVFVGGGLGSVSRYLISISILKLHKPFSLPMATITANVLACIVMVSVFYFGYKEKELQPEWRLFWLIGFCGGFSTFSTFSLENWYLLKDGLILGLILNVLISVGFCLGVFILGAKLLPQ